MTGIPVVGKPSILYRKSGAGWSWEVRFNRRIVASGWTRGKQLDASQDATAIVDRWTYTKQWTTEGLS